MITAAFDIVGVDAGFGRHVYYLLPSETSTAIKYIILSEVAFNLSLATSKSSICVFLLSLIKNSLHNKPKRIFLYSTIALLFVTTVISVSLILATCRPTPKIWNPTIPGTCDGYDLQVRFSYFSGSQSALSRRPDERCSTDTYQRWQPGLISHLQPFRYLLSKIYKSVKRRRLLYGAYCLSGSCRCPAPILLYCSLTLMTIHDSIAPEFAL